MGKEAQRAYWLDGEELCLHCLQPYAFAVERRCSVCDGPACPHCVTVVQVTGEAICSRCTAEQDDEDEE